MKNVTEFVQWVWRDLTIGRQIPPHLYNSSDESGETYKYAPWASGNTTYISDFSLVRASVFQSLQRLLCFQCDPRAAGSKI